MVLASDDDRISMKQGSDAGGAEPRGPKAVIDITLRRN